jgi:cytochrome c553
MKTKADTAVAWVLAVLAASAAFPASAAGNPEAGQQKAAACTACHGPDGNSLADMWPKLAGQLPDYIVKQLKDFKAGKRTDEQMSPQVANLAEADMPDIAAYFATQKIKPGEGDKNLRAKGEQIYLKGKGRPAPVTACVGCHGPAGAGNRDWDKTWSKVPAVLAPGIGGQHAAYVDKQLKAYRSGARGNDPAKVMRDIAARLDDGEIAALAAYVATLKR